MEALVTPRPRSRAWDTANTSGQCERDAPFAPLMAGEIPFVGDLYPWLPIADYEACRHRLWVHLTQHHRDIYDAPHIGGDDPGADFDDHLALVGPERLWVAEIDGQVVGLTGLIVTESSSEFEPIIVDPEHRRRGVAGALIDHLKEVVQREKLPELSVRPVARNALVLDFLAKRGFNTLGRVELIVRPEGTERWVDGAELSGVRFKV